MDGAGGRGYCAVAAYVSRLRLCDVSMVDEASCEGGSMKAYLYIAGLFGVLWLLSWAFSLLADYLIERWHMQAMQEELDASERAHDIKVMQFTAGGRRR